MKSLRKTGTAIMHLATACVLGPGHSRNSSRPMTSHDRPAPQPATELVAPRQGSRSTAQKLSRGLKHYAADWFVPVRSFPFKNRPVSREAPPHQAAMPEPTSPPGEIHGAGPLPPHAPIAGSGHRAHFGAGDDTGMRTSIPDAAVDPIAEYLARTYGAERPTTSPSPSSTAEKKRG